MTTDLQALDVLVAMAGRTPKPVPAERLAEHVLRVTTGADWPVVEAAMQAVLRRIGFARRDALHVASRPGGQQRLGPYRTRVPGKGGERPYRTQLVQLEPFEGRCDCRDFGRSSLGLCKHLFVVLEDLYASKRKQAQARAEGRLPSPTPLRWDFVRPLTGPGDWLEGSSWDDDVKPPSALTRSETRARGHFGTTTGRLKKASVADPVRRRQLVDDLRAALPRGAMRDAVDPALVALLEREHTQLAWRDKTRSIKPAQWSKGLQRKLYPYQREGVERFLQTGRLLLGDDMGLGKTTQAVAACHALHRAGQVRRGLVITPASLKWQWLSEWEKVTDTPAALVEGSPDERRDRYAGWREGFLILNYELLLRDEQAIRDMGIDMVVLDEAQRIKNWATKTATRVKSLRVPYRLVLTGTPMENRLDELASIYDWVDDLALEPKWRLSPQHAMTVQADDGKGEVIGARHLDTLRARMAPTFLRRVRRDVLAQLPPRTETRVPAELTAEQAEVHGELDRPVAALLRMSKRRPLRQPEFLRLMSLLTNQRIICNGLAQHDFDEVWPDLPPGGPRGPRQLRGLFSPKLEELRRLVEDLVVDQGRKVVVFSQWRKMLRLAGWAVGDVLAQADRRAVYFTGAESTKQRTRGVVELHDDPQTAVMFLTDAGGVGLNLQRAATACINLELPWNPAVLEQRIGRIYRLGQTEPVDIYNLVSMGGIESRIADVVTNKRELFDGLFDGTTDELHFSAAGGGMAQIEKLVELPDDTVLDESMLDESIDSLTPDSLAPEVTESSAEVPAPSPPPAPREASHPEGVQELLSSLSVQRTAEGGLVLEAPPESAEALASLFGAMAQLLRAR